MEQANFWIVGNPKTIASNARLKGQSPEKRGNQTCPVSRHQFAYNPTGECNAVPLADRRPMRRTKRLDVAPSAVAPLAPKVAGSRHCRK